MFSKDSPLVSRTNAVFKWLVTISLSCMVALVFGNAVLRYCFNSSIAESEELSRYFFIWTCFLGIVAAYASNRHIGVNLLREKLKGLPLSSLMFASFALELAAFITMFIGGLAYIDTVGAARGQATGIPQVAIVSSIIFASIAMMLILFFRTVRFFKGRKKKSGVN